MKSNAFRQMKELDRLQNESDRLQNEITLWLECRESQIVKWTYAMPLAVYKKSSVG